MVREEYDRLKRNFEEMLSFSKEKKEGYPDISSITIRHDGRISAFEYVLDILAIYVDKEKEKELLQNVPQA